MGHKLTLALLGITLLFAAPKANAQAANAGDIRGTATDISGALLPDVSVTLLNTRTGVSKALITNKDGLYDSGPIVTGNYTLTFSKAGFANFVRSGLNLDVATVTINGQLKAGGVNQEVVVNTDVPLIETETGEQSATLGFKEMEQLPNVGGQGPSWENFTTLIPGATGTASAPLGKTPGQSVSVNGNLPYSSVLADGAVSTLSHSGNADVNVFETIQEVKISSSAFSAQYGIGGIIFNQITKGGTNNFHGSLYEYNQNDVFNARPYDFSTSPVKKNRVRFNNFGGSVGGPVWKDKAFFFFNYDQIINNSASSGYITVPTLAQRNGDFSQELVPGLTCQPANLTANGQGTPGCIYDPATQTTVGGKVVRQPFAGNIINRIDPVAKAIEGYYPTPNVAGTVTPASYNAATDKYTLGQTTNNYYYQVTSPNPYKKYFGRFDYNVNAKNRITASVQQRDNPAFFPNQGICPINCYPGDVDSTNAQITDVTNFSSSAINEARIGYTKQLNFYIGQTIGQGYPAKIGLQFAHADAFPTVNVGSNIYGLAPGISAIYKEHVFDMSDVVTLIRGRHILHFGGEFLFYEDNSTSWGNINAATVGFDGRFTRGTVGDSNSGFSYADFLLGSVQSYSSSVSPEYAARQKSPQMFIQDDFKIRPNLTLNLGLRYQVQLGWHDAKNNQATFDPTIMNPVSNTLGATWYAATKANGRSQLQQNVYSTVLPRVGFAYTARPNFVIRGGYGLYAYDWSLDTYGSGQGDAFTSSGSTSDQTNGVTAIAQLSGTGAGLPYNPPSTSPARSNGQNAAYNPYHTPVAKIHQYNLAVEQQIGADMAIQVAYVGSHGFDLAYPSDINQVPESKLSASDAQFRPFVQYQQLGGNQYGAISNYNSLQISFNKRLARGFSFNTNYTWSKFLDEADSSGWGSRAGTQVYQRSYDFRSNYGPSNFDVRHAWKGDFVYNLPFGKGAPFLNNNWLVDEVIGGWRASGTYILNTGNPFTPTVNSSTSSYALSGNGFRWFPNLVGNPVGTHGKTGYFNQAAYAIPAAGTFGNVHRNSLVGPGFVAVNASLGKTFHVYEALNMSIRADANNILNHPNFGQPNTNIDTGGAAITSISGNMRNMQLSARFAF